MSLRGRLLAASLGFCLLALGGLDLLLGRVLARVVAGGFEARLEAALDALAAGLERDPRTGQVVLRAEPPGPAFTTPLSGWGWEVEEEGRLLFASASLWQARLGADGTALDLLARRVEPPGGGAALDIRVAAPSALREAELAAARRPLRLALLGFAAALLLLSLAQIALVLAPLRRLGRDVAALRAGRTARLPPAPVAELAPLVEEVNALRDLDSARVERAGQQAADLAHGIKTPLAAIRNAMTGLEGGAAATLGRATARIERQLRHHLLGTRLATGPARGARCAPAPVLEDLLVVLRALHGRRGLMLEAELPDALPDFAGRRADLEDMLGNLLDNACNWAEGRVRVSVMSAAGRLAFAVEDDGPGLSPEEAAAVLARGARLDESRAGHGLGLAIVAGLAALHGGGLALDRAALGGLRARLDLPATG